MKATPEFKWRRPFHHPVLLAIFLTLLVLAGPGCSWVSSWVKPKEPPEVPPEIPAAPREQAPAPDAEAAKQFETLLKAASDKVKSARDFHCLLVRVEVVEDELRPAEELDYYQRFSPHSLKLEWVGERFKGRKVIYVAGANDDKVLVQAGGLSGRVTGWIRRTLRFDLTSYIVRSQSRYLPDVAGYDRLVERMREVYTEAREDHLVRVNASSPTERDGRKIQRFDVTLDPPLLDVDVSRMIVWFDLDSSLPVHTILYDGSGRMVEDYDWRDIEFDVGLTDADFTFE